jgi:hypothetical protein
MQDLFILGAPNTAAIVIDSLTLEQYHKIIHWNLAKFRIISSAASTIVKVGAIVSCPPSNQLEDAVEISVLNPGIYVTYWAIKGMVGEVTEDGWTRY